MTTKERNVRLAEALIYLAATGITVYLTVEEWRINVLVQQVRSMFAPPKVIERGPREPSPAEISALHEETRSILRGETT